MKPLIHILHNEDPRRLKYVCDFIFVQLAGCDCHYIKSTDKVDKKTVVISYGVDMDERFFYIKSCGLLEPGKMDASPFPNFNVDSLSDDFDYFSFVFFHLTRMEEYNSKGDEHGRFVHKGSWSDKNELHLTAVVDTVIDKLYQKINTFFNREILNRSTTYQPVVTVDVDQWFSYQRKGVMRNLGGAAKDFLTFRWKRLIDRCAVTLLGAKDPYDELSWMTQKCHDVDVDTILFFLTKGRGQYDKQVPLRPEDFSLIAENNNIGIHPSYSAYLKQNQLRTERNELRMLSNREITKSRFHFLKMRIPDSYLDLVKTGLTADYSMTWPDNIGFRSGTCHSHYFYNLESETELILKIHPTIAMDVVLKDKLELEPMEAVEVVRELVNVCRRAKGPCVILWHNSSFDETEGWFGWRKVFLNILNDMVGE
jgi:hypothetical protein